MDVELLTLTSSRQRSSTYRPVIRSAPLARHRHARRRTFFGHPRGLATLFFTEMWERFSYYGMRALLDPVHDRAGRHRRAWPMTARPRARSTASTPSWCTRCALPGGWIADRLIGQRRAVLYGGVLIAIGHYTLADSRADDVLLGPALHRPRHGAPQAEHQRDRRRSLRGQGQRAMRGSRSSTWASTLGAFFGPLIPAIWRSTTAFRATARVGRERGTTASPRPASA